MLKTFYGRNLQLFLIRKVIVSGIPFQPSLMFVARPGAYPIGKDQVGRLRPCSQTIGLAGKTYQGQTR